MLEPPTFPEPVISMAVEQNSSGDREKMSEALHISRKTRPSGCSPAKRSAS